MAENNRFARAAHFFVDFLPSLHDYNVKIYLQGNSPSSDIFSELELTLQSFKTRETIVKVTFSLPLPLLMYKAP